MNAAYFTCYRCGCTLLATEPDHPVHCPHHPFEGAGGRTERIAPTEWLTDLRDDAALGLQVAS